MPQKKKAVYIILLGLWIGLCLYFDLKLSQPIFYQTNIFAQAGIVLFLICINLFWFYGLYHLIFPIFSYFLSKNRRKTPLLPKSHSKVAILYTTMNDFQPEAVLSYQEQDYDNFDIYILDDSSDELFKEQISIFVSKYPEIKLIRRKNRAGFKAGNLNHCLNLIHSQYPYFAVCDADTILPKDFLSKLVPYFLLDEKIAFVQANQKANLNQRTNFAQIFAFNTDIHWKYYVPVKEKYGFMMFYGHGAIIKTKAWQEIDGFPEITTEDLAFSSLLREKGYFGVFAQDVYCEEDFPSSYKNLRRRNRRWLTGTTEYLVKYFPSLLKAKDISWVEKIDVLASAMSLVLAFPFLIYILVAGILLPFSQNIFKLNIPVFLVYPDYSKNIFEFMANIKYKIYWTKDFYAVMVITSISQLLPLIIDWWRKPIKMLKYIAMFTYLCLATIIVSSYDFLEYLFTKKTYFTVTGAWKQQEAKNRERALLMVEILGGIILFYLAYATSNLWLIIVSTGIILSPLVFRYNLENKIINIILNLPFILNLLLILLIGRALE